MNAVDFLTHLWGPTPPGLIAIWRLHDKHSWYLRTPHPAAYYADGKPDLYTGVALAHKDWGRARRVTTATAAGIPGLWLDLDVNGGPNHKTGAAPDKARAISVAHAIAEPTLLVDSGYGIHAWYLLDTPWRFRSADEQTAAGLAAAQWYQLHRQAAQADGWTVDSTHDLARLLRIPGTINNKGGLEAPVAVIADNTGHRYSRATLLEQAATAGPVEPAAQLQLGDLADIAVTAGARPPADLLAALLENSPEFARAWQHTPSSRTAAWSMSEWDLCLCSLAAQAGWTDQQLADLIAHHRHTHDPADMKAQRVDYVRRTVTKARGDAKRHATLAWVREQAAA